ncbi:MAG TPA: xanthine phosphoribosyltransferase [Candidatus Obscuribacterales bacterium]
MQILRERIIKDGKHLGHGILKVDAFMNHQIDPLLMKEIGQEFARRFKAVAPTRILTAETSGIAPALAAAMALEVPLVFARKHRPVTMAADPFRETAESHTKGGEVELLVSSEYMSPDDRVLIVDDFLATAKTIGALIKLVQQSRATLVGIGAVIEKAFEGGRQALAGVDVPVESLAVIERFDGDRIVLSEGS